MAVFCILFLSFFPITLLRYCLNDFEMFPVVHFIIASARHAAVMRVRPAKTE